MKKKILIIAAALMLLLGYGFGEVTFDKSCAAPDISLIKNIFKAPLTNLSFAQADKIVQDICGYTREPLILDDEKIDNNSLFYRTIDNNTTCKIDRLTGDIFFRKHTKVEGSAYNLPSKANAAAIARQHLMALGLYKKEMGLNKPHVSTLKETVINGQTFEKMRVVTFTRTLDGMPVLGASRAAVMIGAHGDLEGLVVRWMDVKPEKIGQVPGKSQLKKLIKQKLAAKKLDVVVKKANLIIFDNGKGMMKPTLHIEGELITSQGKFFSDWMIPIIK